MSSIFYLNAERRRRLGQRLDAWNVEVPAAELPAGESAPDGSDRPQDDDRHEHPAERGPSAAGANRDHGGDEQRHADGDGAKPRALFLSSHDSESIAAGACDAAVPGVSPGRLIGNVRTAEDLRRPTRAASSSVLGRSCGGGRDSQRGVERRSGTPIQSPKPRPAAGGPGHGPSATTPKAGAGPLHDRRGLECRSPATFRSPGRGPPPDCGRGGRGTKLVWPIPSDMSMCA